MKENTEIYNFELDPQTILEQLDIKFLFSYTLSPEILSTMEKNAKFVLISPNNNLKLKFLHSCKSRANSV